jgi:O-antigen/teichoic acid export membrane protein
VLLKLLRAPSIRVSWYYAASGACFAIATLAMARIFPPTEFGVVALAIAITNVGVVVASAGLAGVRLRHAIRTDGTLLKRALEVVLSVGALLGLCGLLVYELAPSVALAIVAAVAAGGMTFLGLVPFQKAHRFEVSVPFGQTGNLMLLVSAAFLFLLPAARVAWLPTAIVALAYGIVTAWLWRHPTARAAEGVAVGRQHRHDATQFTLFAAADEVMWQLERLLIPILLGIGDLAVFAVIGAIAIAPYHVLASAATATLTPRLQAATPGAGRRSLMIRELRVMVGLAFLGGVLILICVPPLVAWYLGPKIAVTIPVLLAAIAGGTARVLAAIARAPAAAFGTGSELTRISAGAWLALALGMLAAWWLANFALTGLVLGVAFGWLVRGAVAVKVAWHHVSIGGSQS